MAPSGRSLPGAGDRLSSRCQREGSSVSAQIIDRGRGPEIEGTRVTVYRIMDYVQEGSSPERMAAELGLTAEQVQAALTFITANQQAVAEEYQKILERCRQANPAWVEAGRPATAEELRQRIR